MGEQAYSVMSSVLGYVFTGMIVFLLLLVSVNVLRQYRLEHRVMRRRRAEEIGCLVPLSYEGANIPLKPDNIIGSGSGADIKIDDNIVSDRHAQIYLQKGVVYIADMGSSYGTEVNGELLENLSVPLYDGDSIRVGNSFFKVVLYRK